MKGKIDLISSTESLVSNVSLPNQIAISETLFWPSTGNCIQCFWSLSDYINSTNADNGFKNRKKHCSFLYDCKEVVKNNPKHGILQKCQNSHLLNHYILIYFFPILFLASKLWQCILWIKRHRVMQFSKICLKVKVTEDFLNSFLPSCPPKSKIGSLYYQRTRYLSAAKFTKHWITVSTCGSEIDHDCSLKSKWDKDKYNYISYTFQI